MTGRRLALALPIALAACVPAARAPAPRPAPAAPAPATLLPPPAPDWQDLPLTPGGWSYRREPGGSAATFGDTGTSPLFILRCVVAEHGITLFRNGGAAGTMTITTSYGPTRLPAAASAGGAAARLAAADPFLDRIAFSRGRFTVEVPGTARLVLPAWAEPGRVIEDCRE